MAATKKPTAAKAHSTKTIAAKTKPVRSAVSTPVSEPQVEQLEKQSQFATILIGLLIIASGLLIYNFFQSTNQPQTTSQDTNNQQATPTPTPIVGPNDNKMLEGRYTVVAGDSLWVIAEKVYGDGFQWTKIAAANDLHTDSHGRPTVSVGQVLVVPDSAARIVADAGSNTNTNSSSDGQQVTSLAQQVKVGSATYTVVRGDTLWEVAEQVYGDGQKWTLIYNDPHNRLGRLPGGQVLIHAGNILYLPQAP